MLSLFRPSFEVVKEGRILKKIKHLETRIESFFILRQVYVRFWTKMGCFMIDSLPFKLQEFPAGRLLNS